MNVGIIAPSPVPFSAGGAERLWWNLLDAIRRRTPHQADLIKLPSPGRTFWEMIDSYRAFAALDVSGFDCVITGKNPSWMVRHPHHVCYMLHPLRGVYDTYHTFRLPERYADAPVPVQAVQRLMARHAGRREALDEFFGQLAALRQAGALPPEATAVPSPFLREVVHFLDGIGLAPGNVRRYAAISRTVARRPDYFPPQARVEVLYPPSDLPGLRGGAFEYLFTVSRLDTAKRIGLLIEAMQHVRADVELRIAGDGPEAGRLRELARGDKRITFLGYVADDQLAEHYADALAVLFVPFDEDYGLVTLEAMQSGKPVLTTTDSGGVCELVRHGETGYSVPADPRALAERMQHLCAHRDEARALGREGQARVREITWEKVLAGLLEEPGRAAAAPAPAAPRRPKIAWACTYPVYPPEHGGALRVYHLARELGRRFDVELVSLAHAEAKPFAAEIAPGVREIRVPRSQAQQQAEWEIERQVGVPAQDLVMMDPSKVTPGYLGALEAAAHDAALVGCGPYLLAVVRSVADKPLWYDCHNVEADLKRGMFRETAAARRFLAALAEAERECCRASRFATVCSEEDQRRLMELYGAERERLVVVPNGVDVQAIPFTTARAREAARERLGIDAAFLALFIGSWHEPNIRAVRHLFAMARELPDVGFLVAGGCGAAVAKEDRPANVNLLGAVDAAVKSLLLEVADVALNPMTSGSGTNLKMLEYFAAGIPVISTLFGTRGQSIEPGEHCVVCALEEFPAAIRGLRAEDPAAKARRCGNARTHVESRFDWPVVVSAFPDAW